MFLGLTPEGADALPESRAFVEGLNIPWPNAYGAGETVEALGVRALPTVFVVGRDGKIIWNSMMEGDVADFVEQAL